MDRQLLVQGAIVAALVLGGGTALVNIFTRDAPPAGKTTNQHRVREGPYVASEKALSASEDLRIVVVPSRLHEVFDKQCLIYRNREFNQVVFTCPDVRQEDLEKPEP